MRILLRLVAALMLVCSLAACGETTARGTGSATVFNPITGQPTQTQQNIDVTVKRTGIGAPSSDSVLGNMLGGNAGGGSSYGYGSAGFFGNAGYAYLPGTIFRPDGSAWCPNPAVRPSGQMDCIVWSRPYPTYYSNSASGSGYYGTGAYYTTMQNGKWVQKQDIQPGFKVNLMPDGIESEKEDQELLKDLEREIKLRLLENRSTQFQGA